MNDAPRRCYVHVGLPKTGTSYLQSIFWHSRAALEEQDLQMLPATKSAAFHLMLAVRGLLRAKMDPAVAFTALDRFRDEAASLRCSRALVSQELLGAATPEQVATLLDALPGYEVHLIVTVRDLARHVPSAWQQQVKARGVTSYDRFCDESAGLGSATASRPAHDIHGVLDRWGSRVPPERIHVVTVPKQGMPPGVLLERFCTVVGLEPARLDQGTFRSNSSLGLVQAELLRRVNVALGDRLPHPRSGYREQGKQFLAQTILLRQRGEPPRLSGRMAGWCAAASQAIVDRLANGGYDIVGDLDDLLPDPSAFAGDDQEVSDAQVAHAATAALAAILVVRSGESEEMARLREQLHAQRKKIKVLRQRNERLAAVQVESRAWFRGALSRGKRSWRLRLRPSARR